MVAIFIDLDDTLIRRKKNAPRLTRMTDDLHRMLHVLADYDLPPSLLEVLARTPRLSLFWNTVMTYLYSSALDPTQVATIRHALHEIILNHESRDHEHCYLPEETLPFLNQLHNESYRLILLTNTSRQELEKIFRRFPLEGYFHDSITRDDVRKMKPDPEGALRILSHYQEQTFIIIDDLDYGVRVAQKVREAGYRGSAILVNRGRYQEDDLKQLMPDYVVTLLTEIPPLIHQILNRELQERVNSF